MTGVRATRWTPALIYSVFTSAFVFDCDYPALYRVCNWDETNSLSSCVAVPSHDRRHLRSHNPEFYEQFMNFLWEIYVG